MPTSVQAQVPEDSPMMVAWRKYEASDEYANSEKWARIEAHTKGAMWAAFVAGFIAALGTRDAD